jgi:hypothetical protein
VEFTYDCWRFDGLARSVVWSVPALNTTGKSH